jgi:elongation factor P--(R)-beta-lysine ligase
MRKKLIVRAKYLTEARAFFKSENILEVETAILGACAVTDPHVECITTSELQYLRPSPEYRLKELVVAGSGDIFEIGKVFRQGEKGSKHSPEFTLVEWYRVGFQLQDIIDDTVKFISQLALHSKHPVIKVNQISYKEAFMEHIGLDPLSADIKTIKKTVCKKLAGRLSPNISSAMKDDKQAWLDLIMSHHIEPEIYSAGPDSLTVLTHFPAEQALLARINNQNPKVAERFEIYFRGQELANGFYELNNANEQMERFKNDLKIRKNNGQETPEIDQIFINSLRQGLPECSGVAVGMDRLIMSCEGYSDISETLSASH